MSDEISQLTKTLGTADPEGLAMLLMRAIQKLNEAQADRDMFAKEVVIKTNQLGNIVGALIDAGTFCDGTTDIINGINRLAYAKMDAEAKVGFSIVRNQNAMTILQNVFHSDAPTVLSNSVINNMHQFMHEDEEFVHYLRRPAHTPDMEFP